MAKHWVVSALLLVPSLSNAQTVVVPAVKPPEAAPAAPPPQAAPAQGPAWAGKPVRTSHWVTLEGDKGKKFLVNSDEFDAFKTGAEAAAPIALYEGDIPASGWKPSWEAMKNYALWSTAATLKVSEYRLEKPKGGGVAYDAVKGDERVAVIESGRGGRMTVATVTISKPAAAPAPATVAPAPAPGPLAATPPAQVAPNPTTTGTGTGTTPETQTATTPGAAGNIEAAAAALYPADPSAARLAAAVVRQREIDLPGTAQAFIESVKTATERGALGDLRNAWNGRMKDACSRRALGSGALEQAQSLAMRMTGEGATDEDAHAGMEFDETTGPLDAPCAGWSGAAAGDAAALQSRVQRAAENIRPVRLDAPTQVAPLPPPPSPRAAAETAADGAGKPEAAKKKGGLSGGIFKFLAVIAGAALGAVLGSFMGPTVGLIGMAVGAGLGLYIAGKGKKE